MCLKIVATSFLFFACIISTCLAHKKHEENVVFNDASNITSDAPKSKLKVGNGEKKETIAHVPYELNWDWGNFNVKSIDEENHSGYLQRKDRKTIIPLEGIVFAKVKDNHVIKPKLSSRFFPTKRKSKIHVKPRLSRLSRRFELYPRWFSNSIPNLFGKHFARRYYKPFGSIQSGSEARHHILHRHRKPRTHTGTIFHDLPVSWMTGDSRNEIPKKQELGTRGEEKYEVGGEEEAKIEGIESPTDNNLILDTQSIAEGRDRVTDIADKKGLPFLKDIPHEVMAELNPYEYTILPGKLITLFPNYNFSIMCTSAFPAFSPILPF